MIAHTSRALLESEKNHSSLTIEIEHIESELILLKQKGRKAEANKMTEELKNITVKCKEDVGDVIDMDSEFVTVFFNIDREDGLPKWIPPRFHLLFREPDGNFLGLEETKNVSSSSISIRMTPHSYDVWKNQKEVIPIEGRLPNIFELLYLNQFVTFPPDARIRTASYISTDDNGWWGEGFVFQSQITLITDAFGKFADYEFHEASLQTGDDAPENKKGFLFTIKKDA